MGVDVFRDKHGKPMLLSLYTFAKRQKTKKKQSWLQEISAGSVEEEEKYSKK